MLKDFNIDKNWSLFLDRDGVINKKLENDYVKKWDEFVFLEGSLDAISIMNHFFGKIFIVTNQRGVGKGLMSEKDLLKIHDNMLKIININNGNIDKIYYSTDVSDESNNRKPNIGMGKKALKDFPDIDFKKSIMVGDSHSDIEFGKNLGMKTVLISHESETNFCMHDLSFNSIFEFSKILNK